MKIILAIDGSPCSDTAVGEVARMPLPADTQVLIVRCKENQETRD
ncbi:MAG TPA: hypothetical protein VEX60_01055 [Pyrinomonadaceae bacterium]|nr:hypothetical protein [Pyrinomonadaceae bacterium]